MRERGYFSRSSRKSIGCIVFLLLFLFIMWFYSWVKHGGYFLIVNKDDPDDVVLVFTLSLMQNKEHLAKSIVAQELWPQLDSWFATHQAVSCPFPFFDGDSYSMGGFNRSYDEENNQYLYEASIIDNSCNGSFYYLEVENIVVHYPDQKWQIVEWGNNCETSGRESQECVSWP